MDIKIDYLIKTVKEIKDVIARKKEVKMMIKEVVREKMGNIKQELEQLRRMIQGVARGPTSGTQ